MELFTEMDDEKSSLAQNISRFERLNKSTGRRWRKIRKVLGKWFEHYPKKHQHKLRGRFKDEGINHLSALFELYLHELFFQLDDYEIQIHPELSWTDSKPDFKITKNNSSFYLEATTSYLSDSKESDKKRRRELYDYLNNNLECLNFKIMPAILGTSKKNPKVSEIKKELESRISEFDPDTFLMKDRKNHPQWIVENKGWIFTFTPIPIRSNGGKKSDENILENESHFRFFSDDYGIKKKLEEKSSRYGSLKSPYLIAVNIWNEYTVYDPLVESELFGHHFLEKEKSINISGEEDSYGYWYGSNGPKNQNVSAVLVANNLNEWNIARQTPKLWHNPWSENELDENKWPFYQNIFYPGEMEKKISEGVKPWSVLGLNYRWPDKNIRR